MSIYVEAARLLASLAALGQQFSGPTGPQADFPNGEYLAGSVTSISADGLVPFAAMGRKIAVKRAVRKLTYAASEGWVAEPDPLQRATAVRRDKRKIRDFKKAADTSLIAWALTVVEVLELTAGFGPPYDGAELTKGFQQFAALSGQLMVALPDDSWHGTAAQAYAEANTTRASTAQTMAELDRQLGALICDQANWVTHVRLAFGILKDLLLGASIIESAMKLTSPSGLAPARLFALTACALGLSAVVGMLVTLGYFSHANAQRADLVATQYAQLAKDPVPGDAVIQAKMRTTPQKRTVSDTCEGPVVASVADASAGQRTALRRPWPAGKERRR
ncbi:hypothetical protein A5641_07320 [Mycobacterium sp. 1554424.7]|nr:hypothetical protein A5641_07320 [Mycobacterium sp. 1554424.7]